MASKPVPIHGSSFGRRERPNLLLLCGIALPPAARVLGSNNTMFFALVKMPEFSTCTPSTTISLGMLQGIILHPSEAASWYTSDRPKTCPSLVFVFLFATKMKLCLTKIEEMGSSICMRHMPHRRQRIQMAVTRHKSPHRSACNK